MKNKIFYLYLSLLLFVNCSTTIDYVQGFTYINDFNKSRLPINFILDASLEDKMFQSVLNRAEIFWQDNIDVPLVAHDRLNFVLILNADNDIYASNLIETRHWIGFAIIDKTNKILSVDKIYISAKKLQSAPFAKKWRVLAHEIGHVFGLAHDIEQGSVMYPLVFDEINSYLGVTTLEPYLSIEDKLFLETVYAK
jgi:hypothetical protein